MTLANENDLIARHVAVEEYANDPAEARLRDSGIHAWALVGDLPLVAGDVAELAANFEIPIEAAQAALAYYRRHRRLIDARLAANTPFAG